MLYVVQPVLDGVGGPSPRKMEETLRRLKKLPTSRRSTEHSAAAAAGGLSASQTDDEKIRQQLLIDLQTVAAAFRTLELDRLNTLQLPAPSPFPSTSHSTSNPPTETTSIQELIASLQAKIQS